MNPLSADAPAPITIGDRTWPTGAHYLLARRFFFDDGRREEIRQAPLPEARGLAQTLGRWGWDRSDDRPATWEEPHMYWRRSVDNLVRRVQFERTRDPAFAAALEATVDAPLALEEEAVPLGTWGRLLVETRTRLRRVPAETLHAWKLPALLEHPEIPRGSIGWRMGYGEDTAIRHHEWWEAQPPALRAAWDRAWAGVG